jgi:GAF domain-containing protein
MLAGDRLIGAFAIYRQTARPFDSKTLDVAQVFADQSVIAIENARLITQSRLCCSKCNSDEKLN